MSHRGVHFIIDDEVVSKIALADDDGVISIVQRIEEEWDRAYLAESDKAWDAIHRCLTDGQLLYDNGDYPLKNVVCGSRQVYDGDGYFIGLNLPNEVRDICSALAGIDKPWLSTRYYSVLPNSGYEYDISVADFEYTFHWFQVVKNLFYKARDLNRSIIFTVET